MPQFYRPQSSWGGAWGKRARCKAGEHPPATLARLLMQLHGSSQVSPQSALGNESARTFVLASGVDAAVCFAGVAQLVEHLFCKQVVAGSSPTASSVESALESTGGHGRAFRVLASFGLRSGAHVLKYAPLRCSPKPRQNAGLRGRVSAGLGAVPRTARLPHQSSSSLLTDCETSESCPSGQREQAVNLPDLSYAGSNPALSTSAPLRGASVSISRLGELSSPSAEVNSAEPPPQVLGPQPQNTASVSFAEPSGLGFTAPRGSVTRSSRGTKRSGLGFTEPSGLRRRGTKRSGFGFTGRGRSRAISAFAGVAQLVERQLSSGGELSSPPSEVNSDGAPPQVSGPHPQNSATIGLGASSFAGVAQLVERQPSKLNVEGSSPFSRSQFSVSRFAASRLAKQKSLATRMTRGSTRVGSLVGGEAEPRTGAERTLVREHRTGGEAKPAAKIPTRQFSRHETATAAHLAQMVEHVLGKDEVTSSILVVGSKP